MVTRVRRFFPSLNNLKIKLVADASDFLRKHPWPGRAISDTFDDTTHRKGGFAKKFMSAMKVVCGRTGQEEDLFDDEVDEQALLFDPDDNDSGRPFYWTRQLQQSFREELEKYIVIILSLDLLSLTLGT